jgi:hypothetical protein
VGIRRLKTTSEASLFDLSGWLLSVATIGELSDGGLLVARLPAENIGGAPAGRQVRFQIGFPDGVVRGLAEIIRVDPDRQEVALRLLEIDNTDGLPRLLEHLFAAG